MQSVNGYPVPLNQATGLEHITDFPSYRQSALACGIGHLGMGNFHRAHQALYIQNLLKAQPGDWMIHGVSMLDRDLPLVNALHEQDNLYTLTERSGTGDQIHVIGSLGQVSHAPSDPTAVIDAFSSDNIKIISLTVTEKGYSNTPSGELNANDPAVQHDLRNGSMPQTTLGYLYAVAEKRMQNAGLPFTIMSCDNLVGNGDMTQRLLLAFAEAKNSAVGRWIGENVSFPNTMVDRITPAATAETASFVAKQFGIKDNCPVVCEPYLQWVIEDKFINDRPDLEMVGAQFVPDVKPYEVLKTRMLNGAHSALAYVAYLMGYRKVDEAINDPLINEFIGRYMDEDVTPSIPAVPGIDVAQYKATLRERFANPQISDKIERLALDGSAKIGTFIVPPLTKNLAKGDSIRWMSFALAAWCRYLKGCDENGQMITIDDPLKDVLMAHSETTSDLLSVSEVFGMALRTDIRLQRELGAALSAINTCGTREALRQRLHSNIL